MRARQPTTLSPPRGSRPRRPTTTLLTAAALTLTLTACGTDSGSGTFNPTGTTADSTGRPTTNDPRAAAHPSAVPQADADKQAIAAYNAYQAAHKQAYERNDPDLLTRVAIDPILGRVTKDIERVRAKKQVWRFTNATQPKIYSRSADKETIYVVDCVQTIAAYIYSAETGKRLRGGKGSGMAYRFAVHYQDGSWRVADAIRDKKCQLYKM